MLFWTVATLLALAVAALIAAAGLRARADGGDGATDIAVYRAQLAEVEGDAARGTIGADEAGRLKNEIARRILQADARGSRTARSDRRLGPVAAFSIGACLVAGSLALYALIGAPGYGDLALSDRLARAEAFRTSRPDQAEAEAQVPAPSPVAPSADFAALMDKLRSAVATRPDDLEGHRLLARNEAMLGNARAAAAAQSQVLGLLDDRAAAEDYLDFAEYLVMAAGGYVSPQAENALRAAVARDPASGGARYYLGLMWRQTGRPDIAFRMWDRLLRDGPETAAWIAPIRAQIDQVARLAGVDYTQPAPSEALPEVLAGPSAEDVANAAQMSDDDRAEMIRGMVSRLSERLATQGGPAQEWARLIGAYGVLGDRAQARAIRDEALQVFEGSEGDLALIRDAARDAGLDG